MTSIRNGLENAQTSDLGDERLYEAMMLLNRPMKKRAPGYVPIIAVLGIVGSGMFLTYTLSRVPVSSPMGKAALVSGQSAGGATMLSRLDVPVTMGTGVSFEVPANPATVAGGEPPVVLAAEVVPQYDVGHETVNLDGPE